MRLNKMERKNFKYSLKNIPVPSEDNYMKTMISKVESLLRRMRWKAFFFDKKKQSGAEEFNSYANVFNQNWNCFESMSFSKRYEGLYFTEKIFILLLRFYFALKVYILM